MRRGYYALTRARALCFDVRVTAIDEQELRRAWDAGDYSAATTLALERYGPEIFRVLAARLRSDSDAADVFSLFAEALWRGLPGFQWRSTLRAWAYRIARNSTARWAMASERKPERNLPMEGSIVEVAVRVRSSTLVHVKTEVKSEVRRLREELPEPDQMLLILRVDRELEWDEVVAAMVDDDLPADELKREAARLRKRFQLVTEKLRTLARERGILDR
jgi:RNA polymerase sigma-70 factor (ECF subfamily)